MTIREIAEAAGCGIATVKRWVSVNMPTKMINGKTTIFTPEEALRLMKSLPKRNMVSHLSQVPRSNDLGTSLTQKDIDLISSIVSKTVSMTLEHLDARMDRIETRIEQRAALLPAPQIKSRDHISKLVRDNAHRTQREHRIVWKDLYREFGYRTNTSPGGCSKNRGMTIMDYIEAEGQLEVLESVALDFLAVEAQPVG